MNFRILIPLLALTALITLPQTCTAKEEVAKKECEKCDKDKKCEKCLLEGIQCPVSGKAIDQEVTALHHGGKVFFCCEHCLAAWKKDSGKDGKKKFTAKANYQLVATCQAKQKGCPMSGKGTKENTIIQVGSSKAKVGFCCNHCQENAQGKEGDDQIAMIFNEKSFAKAFEMVKKEKEATAVN